MRVQARLNQLDATPHYLDAGHDRRIAPLGASDRRERVLDEHQVAGHTGDHARIQTPTRIVGEADDCLSQTVRTA